MKRKIRWSTVIPLLLTVYLAVMVALGWESYKIGATSGLLYFGGTAVVAACIICLHRLLKAKEDARKG